MVRIVYTLVLAYVVVAGARGALAQTAIGTAFTFQGRLTDGGSPANGSYDMQFVLYDAATGGNQIGGAQAHANVAVTGGTFTVLIDFGTNAIAGLARWLEVGVRPGGTTGSYSLISPRQRLTPTPFAIDTQRLAGRAASDYRLQADVVAVAQGGTGAGTAAAARSSLGAQARISQSCSVGSSIRAIAEDGSVTCDGGVVPAGAVMHFNLNACPSGWSELVDARGRYLVGLPSGGTLALTQGTPLSNGEDRPTGQHRHERTVYYQTSLGPIPPGRVVPGGGSRVGSGVPPGSTPGLLQEFGAPAFEVAGTNSPYIQLLVCQKN